LSAKKNVIQTMLQIRTGFSNAQLHMQSYNPYATHTYTQNLMPNYLPAPKYTMTGKPLIVLPSNSTSVLDALMKEIEGTVYLFIIKCRVENRLMTREQKRKIKMAFEEFYFMGQRDAVKLWRALNDMGFGDVELSDLLPRFTDCFPRRFAKK